MVVHVRHATLNVLIVMDQAILIVLHAQEIKSYTITRALESVLHSTILMEICAKHAI